MDTLRVELAWALFALAVDVFMLLALGFLLYGLSWVLELLRRCRHE